MTHIIAIANEKGGVAKTTTAISIGGALVEMGFETLLIDLDAQANLTLGLGINPVNVRHSVADMLVNSASIISISRETNVPGLDIVPSNADMGMAERFLPVRQNYEYLLKNIFLSSQSLSSYDFIILDCPPSLGSVTANALTAAHIVIIPTLPEFFSANGLRNLMAMIRRIRSQTNPDLAYYILITMMDRRNRIHCTLSEQLRLTFKEGLLNTTIEIDTKLRESSVAGMPITHFTPHTRSAMQYRALAQELIQDVKEKIQ